MARSCAIRHAAAGGGRSGAGAGNAGSDFDFAAHSPFVPGESGDPDAKHTAKHFGLSKSGPPLPRGRTVIVARPELASSVAKEPLRAEQDSKQRRSAPVCMLRAGGRPHSSVLTSLASRGMARRQGAMPGSLQADVRQRPDHDAQLWCAPAPCGAPTGIFGLRLVNARTGQELSVPGRFLRASPVGRFA
jgi:hypothetical protein